MKLSYYIFYGLCLIICNDYLIINVNALVGLNIKHPKPNEYLFVVSLVRVNNTSSQKICIGSLVTRKDVLTAEHCLVGEELPYTVIVAGSIDFRLGTRYSLHWWISYEWWSSQFQEEFEYDLNDVAMLRLLESVPDFIIPAPLAEVPNAVFYELQGTIATYSAEDTDVMPTIMDLGVVTIKSHKKCSKKCSKLIQAEVNIDWRFLCSNAEPYILLEHGDSGGPLLHKGVIIAVNSGACPTNANNEIPIFKKMNVHIGIEYFKAFIDVVIATP